MLLGWVKYGRWAGALLVLLGGICSALLKVVAHSPDHFGREWNESSDLGGADALRHLQQGEGA